MTEPVEPKVEEESKEANEEEKKEEPTEEATEEAKAEDEEQKAEEEKKNENQYASLIKEITKLAKDGDKREDYLFSHLNGSHIDYVPQYRVLMQLE